MKNTNFLKGTFPFLIGLLLAFQGCQKPIVDNPPTKNEPISNTQIQNWDINSFPSKTMTQSFPALKSASLVNAVSNGGFEDGFNGWTIFATGYGISGDISKAWYVGAYDPYNAYYSGPFSHYEALAHSGEKGATAIENGGTLHKLHQDVTIPTGIVELKFWIRWKNAAGNWYPSSQNIQVNLTDITTSANLTTLFDAYTLGLPMFSGGGNSTTANYEQRTFDISAFAGQTVRLEFISLVYYFYMFVDFDDIEIVQVAYPAQMDIKPGGGNVVNLKSKGTLPVALLSDANFDATTMNLSTITLGNNVGTETPIIIKNNGQYQTSFEDVNGDGLRDLMMHFSTQQLITNGDLNLSTTVLKLNGYTTAGRYIIGNDNIVVIN